MRLQPARLGASHILFDADRLPSPAEALFEPGYWRSQNAVVGQGEGRGEALFVRQGADTWVLRHYRRGGWAAKVFGDRYFTPSVENSRAWRELRLTSELRAQGLPVPVPVAACVHGTGLWRRADLITVLLPQTRTLASALAQAPLPAEQWAALGRLLRRFHDAGLLHHDINARNLLLDAQGQFHLIDLDKASLQPSGAWKERTRLRLLRSLRKFKAREPVFHFFEENWLALTAAYRT